MNLENELCQSCRRVSYGAKLAALLDVGVGTIIDLTTPEDPLAPYDLILERFAHGRTVTRHHMPIPDLGVCAIEEMVHILDSIDTALSEGQTVYVHCWGGVGRTGTVIGCWMVRHGKSGEDALAEVARLFATMSESKQRRNPRGSPETSEQREMVRTWKIHDRE